MENIRNLPPFIPYPTAWLSAVLLILLFRGISVIIRIILSILQLGDSLMVIAPKWRFLLYFVTLLSPIVIIAVTHHWLHIVLDRFFPNTRSQQMAEVTGIVPTLMSWWEGFYGWMAITLAFVVSQMIQIIFLPQMGSLYDTLAWWEELRDLFTLPTLYRLVTVAYLYQLEYLVRQHLMAVGANQGNASPQP
ncbi:hypothetical protein [Coleofasciculus sp.]|uniref:hypothetical protein n=1 Tax=Coleofasciculus sp. TaxID=3100458 RepID=UPI003A3F865A